MRQLKFISGLVLIMCLMWSLSFRNVQSNTSAAEQDEIKQEISRLNDLLKKGSYSELSLRLQEDLRKYPGNAAILSVKKNFILQDYRNEFSSGKGEDTDKTLYSIQPDALRCRAGKLTNTAFTNVLKRINYLRRLAGLPDSCYFDPGLSDACQKAAVMMESNNKLSHAPTASWKCYSREAAEAAKTSNLSLGYGFTKAIMGQMQDEGAENYFCGHRRWILDPGLNVFGFGSTNMAMCLKVIGTPKSVKKDISFSDSQFVAWPAMDFFPKELLPSRWSLSLKNADFSLAKVTLHEGKRALRIRQERPVSGYGLNTIVWQVGSEIESSKTYTVEIKGIRMGGRPYKTIRYSTQIVN